MPKTTQQNQTGLDIQSDAYEQLNDKMKQAVDMRIEGFGHKEIARQLKIAHATARWYFQKTGPCYQAYKEQMKLIRQDRRRRFKDIQNQLEDIANDAVIVLKDAIKNQKSPYVVRANASLKVLEMVGFEPVHKVLDVTKRKDPLEKLARAITSLTDYAQSTTAKSGKRNPQPLQDKQ
jgi:hypothetical protein